MRTIATMFSGGEGVGVGAQNAGYTHLWGIELKDNIAQVARDNGFNTITGDVFDIEPETLQKPDVLHASPECQRASVANAKRGETDLDIALGKRVEHYIEVLQPKIFTLENVRPYKHFQAFKSIINKLFNLGYMVDIQNLCAADFGVPQSRRRVILRASRIGLLPNLPPKEKWIGWYEAIEDLIPDLPESKFADWQLKRLEKEKWFNLHSQEFMVSCENSQSRGGKTRDKAEPSFTLSTASGLQAFIVEGSGGYNRPIQCKDANEPVITIRASRITPYRALLSQGKVVSMTTRALARFQSFPDWYKLPDNKTLACKIIGNAVPCLMYQKIIEQFKVWL